ITGNPGGPITLAKSAHTGPILLADDTLLDDLGSGFGSAVDRPGIAEWGLWDGNRIEGLGV
ncbi:hypothetical protein, partial [Mycolicibacterium conceptionense]|uniref:hypothetical protein n=1 Tax=Mycolicibacterium conceptionense TaxID=451644 RepID=UPI001A96B070